MIENVRSIAIGLVLAWKRPAGRKMRGIAAYNGQPTAQQATVPNFGKGCQLRSRQSWLSPMAQFGSSTFLCQQPGGDLRIKSRDRLCQKQLAQSTQAAERRTTS
jgi:hypothetical protein